MEIFLRVLLVNRLPTLLADLAETPGHRAVADQMHAEARDAAVPLTRALPHGWPAPRVGDLVLANPNFDPVAVTDVVWSLDEGRLLVELEALDEDQVGASSLELLLGAGWRMERDPE